MDTISTHVSRDATAVTNFTIGSSQITHCHEAPRVKSSDQDVVCEQAETDRPTLTPISRFSRYRRSRPRRSPARGCTADPEPLAVQRCTAVLAVADSLGRDGKLARRLRRTSDSVEGIAATCFYAPQRGDAVRKSTAVTFAAPVRRQRQTVECKPAQRGWCRVLGGSVAAAASARDAHVAHGQPESAP